MRGDKNPIPSFFYASSCLVVCNYIFCAMEINLKSWKSFRKSIFAIFGFTFSYAKLFRAENDDNDDDNDNDDEMTKSKPTKFCAPL